MSTDATQPTPADESAAPAVVPVPRELARAVRGWLDHLDVERGVARNTLVSYTRDLDRYLDYLARAGVRGPGEVTEAHVAGFLAQVRSGSPGRMPLSAPSAARTLVAVRGLHRFLALEGKTSTDPAEGVRPPKTPLRLPKAIGVTEVERLLAAASLGTRRSRCGTGPCSRCSMGRGRGSRRRSGWTSTTWISMRAPSGCSARGPRSGSSRWAAMPERR